MYYVEGRIGHGLRLFMRLARTRAHALLAVQSVVLSVLVLALFFTVVYNQDKLTTRDLFMRFKINKVGARQTAAVARGQDGRPS